MVNGGRPSEEYPPCSHCNVRSIPNFLATMNHWEDTYIKLSMLQYSRSSQELITVQVQQLNLHKCKQPKACCSIRQTDPALKHDHDQIRNKTAEWTSNNFWSTSKNIMLMFVQCLYVHGVVAHILQTSCLSWPLHDFSHHSTEKSLVHTLNIYHISTT